MTTNHYTGRLTRAADGTITGELRDSFGWPIALTATRDPNGSGYILTGTLGEPPANLRIPALDDAP